MAVLEAGYTLELHTGDEATVLAVEDTGERHPVFNLEVADFHTYYVGETGVWVHNTNCASMPRLEGSSTILGRNMGGIAKDHAAHHLIMTSQARNSKALIYLGKKGLYDINRARNGLELPGIESLARKTGMPLHTGFHGPEYRGAVEAGLRNLDRMMLAGATDRALLNAASRLERSLETRLLSGDLWLNETDALVRGLGPFAR